MNEAVVGDYIQWCHSYGSLYLKWQQTASGIGNSYTYAKFLENTNDTGTTVGRDTGPYSDYYNRRPDYGPSANDIRNRFSLSSVYELPFGPAKKLLTSGVLGQVIGGWTIGAVAVVQSGPAMSVITQTNSTNSFSAGSLRPDALRNPNLSSDDQTVARWFDTSAFAQPVTTNLEARDGTSCARQGFSIWISL